MVAEEIVLRYLLIIEEKKMTVKEIYKEIKEKMKDSVQALADRYTKMRGGRAR